MGNGRMSLFLAPQGKDCRLEIGGEELAFEAIMISVTKGEKTHIRVTLADPQGVATTRRYKVVAEDAE